jgi:hypothetical protein
MGLVRMPSASKNALTAIFERPCCVRDPHEHPGPAALSATSSITCTVWAESRYGARDYEPVDLRYGQALLWDGGLLEHGTYPNLTDSTRVSCDFRFHPLHPERVARPWRDVLAGRGSAPGPLLRE